MQFSDSKTSAASPPRARHQPLDLQEHQRLHKEHAHEPSARLLVKADAAIRRAAYRIAGWFGRA